jgi:hypothetical protein
MRYTASANNFLWYLFIPLLGIFYINFILWSDCNYLNRPVAEAIKNKQQAVNSLGSFDGVILGGSNAWFGISAKSLSTLSDFTWANLTLPAEGYSDINYANFISDSISDLKRQDVSVVVYSSESLVRESTKYRKNTPSDIAGKNEISYKPQRSLASYTKDFMGYTKYKPYPVENNYGDLDFSGYPCSSFLPTPLTARKYLNEVELRIWTSEQLGRITKLFPNAKIIITVPNGFNKNLREPNNDARSDLIETLKAILLEYERSGKRSVYLISQKPYPSSELMCVDNWHANEAGRKWRTIALYELINDKLLELK